MNKKQIEDLVDLMFDTDMEEVMKEKSTLEYIHKLQQENKQLKSILTELEDYLKLGICEPAYIKGDMFWQNACEEVLDKIQELKEKYK